MAPLPLDLPCPPQLPFAASLFHGQIQILQVQAVLGTGLSRTLIVGMADAAAREAPERLAAAFRSHGLPWHRGKILLNLVPASLPKGGLPLDLASAVAILLAQRRIPPLPGRWLFLGEVTLDGNLVPPARGTLAAAIAARTELEAIVTPPEAAAEAALVPGILVYAVQDLSELLALLRNPTEGRPAPPRPAPKPSPPLLLEEVRGQEQAREAAIVAACGRHPLFLQGPPGTGKSLLARRLVSLLPHLTTAEALEVAAVETHFSPLQHLPIRPPWRAPHTSTSATGILGGGRPVRPGEISRAHRGILFLDELAEFARPVLEGLRQPLEEREVRLRRAGGWALFPANILLVAACNPCPCGWATHPRRPCTCPPHRLQSYRARLSGPLLDRFDLFVEMGPSPPEVLDAGPTSPTSEEAQHRLHRALDLQQARQGAGLVGPAGQMERPQLEASGLTPAARQRLRAAAAALDWSGRAALRSLRVARTLADLEASESVEEHHVLQAISFRRPMDLPEPERATGPRPPFA